MSDTSHDRATVLRWIAQYYKPETYAAIDFQMFIDYIGDNSKAECLLKDLWVEELIQPLSSETKPAGGITQGSSRNTRWEDQAIQSVCSLRERP